MTAARLACESAQNHASCHKPTGHLAENRQLLLEQRRHSGRCRGLVPKIAPYMWPLSRHGVLQFV